MKTNTHIGNPVKYCSDILPSINCGDRGILMYYPGEHTICDINGNSLKLNDVKTGMLVKIRAKNVHWPGYDYLYTADGKYGKCFVT